MKVCFTALFTAIPLLCLVLLSITGYAMMSGDDNAENSLKNSSENSHQSKCRVPPTPSPPRLPSLLDTAASVHYANRPIGRYPPINLTGSNTYYHHPEQHQEFKRLYFQHLLKEQMVPWIMAYFQITPCSVHDTDNAKHIALTMAQTLIEKYRISSQEINKTSVYSLLGYHLEQHKKNIWGRKKDITDRSSELLAACLYLQNDGYGIDNLIQNFIKSETCQHWDEKNVIFRGGSHYELEKAQSKKAGKEVTYENKGCAVYGKGIYVTHRFALAKAYTISYNLTSFFGDDLSSTPLPKGVLLRIKLKAGTPIIGFYSGSPFYNFLLKLRLPKNSIEELTRVGLINSLDNENTTFKNTLQSVDIAATQALLVFDPGKNTALFETGIIKDTTIISAISAYEKNMTVKLHIKTEHLDCSSHGMVKKKLPAEKIEMLNHGNLLNDCIILDNGQPGIEIKSDVFLCTSHEKTNPLPEQAAYQPGSAPPYYHASPGTFQLAFFNPLAAAVQNPIKEYKYFIINESGDIIRVKPAIEDVIYRYKQIDYNSIRRFYIQYQRPQTEPPAYSTFTR